ncbi:MAG: DUF58 domain-containing protein [Thermoleophilia bacterium]
MTRRGFGLLVLAVGTYAAGRVLGTRELYLLAFAMLAFMGLAQIVVAVTGAGLRVERRVIPSPPSAGEPTTIEVNVENTSKAPSVPVVIRMDLSVAAGAHLTLQAGALGPKRETVYSSEIPGFRRGVYALPAPTVEVVDQLGIARRRLTVGDQTALTVLPSIAPLDSCVFFGGRGRGQDPRTRAALAHASFDLRGVRPHQPGEPLSRIDWKSTAKTGTLMLRETEEHTRSAVVLLLDGTTAAQVGEPGNDTFELAVSALGSIGAFLLREGLAVKLLIHGAHPEEEALEPGERGTMGLLGALALAAPSGNQPVAATLRAFRASVAAGISVVVASPSVDRTLLVALTSLVDRGTPAFLVHVDTAGYREEHEFVLRDKRSLLLELSTRGIPSITVRPDVDLTAALSFAAPWRADRRERA